MSDRHAILKLLKFPSADVRLLKNFHRCGRRFNVVGWMFCEILSRDGDGLLRRSASWSSEIREGGDRSETFVDLEMKLKDGITVVALNQG